jgi:uncharacterized protein (DUF488 family)
MQDIAPTGPETPSPYNRPDHCPRCDGSRKHPHFDRDNLAAALPKSDVEYHWLEALGGRRNKQREESPNLGLENRGFRNYADYMLTEEIRKGVEELLVVARWKRTAIMCAEGLFWQCHRRLVSDFFVASGVTVQHLMPSGELRPHTLTSGAVIESGRVTYPGQKSLFSWASRELQVATTDWISREQQLR